MNLSVSQLTTIMPRVPEAWTSSYADAATKTAAKFAINTPLRMAAWLANIAYESAELTAWGEVGQGGGSFGQYYGRGPLMLTHRENYRLAGEYFRLDLVADPGLVSRNTTVGWDTAGWYWRYGNGDLNTFADEGNLWECYLRILGDDDGSFTARKRYYDLALEVLEGEKNVATVKASQIVKAARELLGVRYTWWKEGDPIPAWFYEYPNSAPPASWVIGRGTMCSDLLNYARQRCGLPSIGGTPAFYDWIYSTGAAFDPTTAGIPGAFCVNPGIWRGGSGQGHIALYTDTHTLIQATDGVGAFAGVNEGEKDYDSHKWAGYWLYGLMPDVDYSEYLGGAAPEPQPTLVGPPRWISLDKDGWERADGPDWARGWFPIKDGVQGKWKRPDEA